MANTINLKEINRNNIYQLIYESEGISKQRIAQKLRLSLSTVSHNLAELKDRGLIKEDGTFDSTGGRKAQVIRCVTDVKLALGLDITANHISLVLVDLKGSVLKSTRPRLRYEDAERYYQTVGGYLRQFILDSGVNQEKILGVGVSLPAIVAADGRQIAYLKVLSAPADLYGKLTAAIPFPFLFFNDANAGGFAEFWHRDSAGQIVYLSLSDSVGGAIIYSHQVYQGENMKSGEFGHIILEPGGRPCYCGKRGCADAYCRANLLSNASGGNLKEFFARITSGDSKCQAIFEEYLSYLAQLICNLRMCFDCDIVLGGYAGSFMGPHIQRLMELLNDRNPFETDGCYVKSCNYKFEASAVGAALYYLDQYIKNI